MFSYRCVVFTSECPSISWMMRMPRRQRASSARRTARIAACRRCAAPSQALLIDSRRHQKCVGILRPVSQTPRRPSQVQPADSERASAIDLSHTAGADRRQDFVLTDTGARGKCHAAAVIVSGCDGGTHSAASSRAARADSVQVTPFAIRSCMVPLPYALRRASPHLRSPYQHDCENSRMSGSGSVFRATLLTGGGWTTAAMRRAAMVGPRFNKVTSIRCGARGRSEYYIVRHLAKVALRPSTRRMWVDTKLRIPIHHGCRPRPPYACS